MSIATTPSQVAAVRFTKVGKLYYFDISDYPELEPADHVIVETRRGRQMGQIMGFVQPDSSEYRHSRAIKRPASPRDMMMRQLWDAKSLEALIICREAGVDLTRRLGVKFIQARYNYDGSLLVFLYTSEEPNINTNNLEKKLAKEFDTRIEIRRVGARDSAKILGEYGACGAPRCCSTHLTEFSPVSIKMAKGQGISLNPSEITGMCGRLRCCLVYEYEQYINASKALPRRNKIIGTKYGDGRVIKVNILSETVTVDVEGVRYEVGVDDFEPLEELKALQRKAAAGCSREGEGGVCECGARVRTGTPPQETTKSQQAQPSAEKRSAPAQDTNKQSDHKKSSRRRRRRRGPKHKNRPDNKSPQ